MTLVPSTLGSKVYEQIRKHLALVVQAFNTRVLPFETEILHGPWYIRPCEIWCMNRISKCPTLVVQEVNTCILIRDVYYSYYKPNPKYSIKCWDTLGLSP